MAVVHCNLEQQTIRMGMEGGHLRSGSVGKKTELLAFLEACRTVTSLSISWLRRVLSLFSLANLNNLLFTFTLFFMMSSLLQQAATPRTPFPPFTFLSISSLPSWLIVGNPSASTIRRNICQLFTEFFPPPPRYFQALRTTRFSSVLKCEMRFLICMERRQSSSNFLLLREEFMDWTRSLRREFSRCCQTILLRELMTLEEERFSCFSVRSKECLNPQAGLMVQIFLIILEFSLAISRLFALFLREQ